MLVEKVIPLESLGSSLLLVLTDDIRKAAKALNKSGYNVEIEETTQGLTSSAIINDATHFYCIITIEESLVETLQTLVHELFHATQDILENKTIKFKKGDANETYAYTLDYMFGVAYPITIKAYNKKWKKKI